MLPYILAILCQPVIDSIKFMYHHKNHLIFLTVKWLSELIPPLYEYKTGYFDMVLLHVYIYYYGYSKLQIKTVFFLITVKNYV